MKVKTRRTVVTSVLVAALAIGALSYVLRQLHNAGTAAKVANIRQTNASGTTAGASSSKGTSGTFTGPTVNAYYGYVKVQAVVKNGKVQKVVVLQHPNDNGTSRYINSVAMPYLVKEAVQAQSAQISLISGATFSSEAFVRSLGSALSKAGV